jgi:ketosteroid isomerase-like protein
MNDIYAINAAKTEFRDGYNTADVDRLLSVFADGFAALSAGVPSFFGYEAKSPLRSRAVSLFQKYRVSLVVTIVSIRVVHNTAYDFGWHTLTLAPHHGADSIISRRRYFELWRKGDDAKWRIELFIDNRCESVHAGRRDRLRHSLPTMLTAVSLWCRWAFF